MFHCTGSVSSTGHTAIWQDTRT